MRHEYKKYWMWGLTALGVLLVLLVAVLMVTNFSGVVAALQSLLHIFAPITYGCAIAYLLNPIVKWVERPMNTLLQKLRVSERKAMVASRAAAIMIALGSAVLLIYALVSMIIPQLIDSITGIVSNMPGYYETVRAWLRALFEDQPTLEGYANALLERIFAWAENWIEKDLTQTLQTVMSTIAASVFSLVKGLLHLLIGLIISVYILASRDKFLAQAKKLIVAAFSQTKADHIMELGRRSHRIFGGFITGKLLDSLIIGVLCFIGMWILKLPYAVLISTIVGVTNVIPFFGPYIGAIPSAILILLVSPLQCFYFIVFILVLQQFDGNILGPHILGDATGLSGFWVVVAITVASGLFGFAGMLLGVPVFALGYTLLTDWINGRLMAKHCPTQTGEYYAIRKVSDLGVDEALNEPEAGEDPESSLR